MLTLKYGHRSVSLALPSGFAAEALRSRGKPPRHAPADLIARSLREPIGGPPLRELARGRRSAAILIPGTARRAGVRDYLPALCEELIAGGVPPSAIEVYLADGTHEQHVAADAAELLGPELASRVRCRGHDCRAEDNLVTLGMTSRGTPVCFNRRVLQAEVKVLTGRIVPHYFAGYSGGRKALVPGVAGLRTIVANHRLTLGSEGGIHPAVRAGSLDGNPVHKDMVEAARMAGPDYCLNTLMDEEHRLLSVVSGDWEAAHREGCRQAAERLSVTLPGPVDALITSAGGHPYDSNFMQALKAVFNVSDVVRSGGAILWIAECGGGVHPGFLELLQIADDDALDRAVRHRYTLTGHNSLLLRRLIRRVDVALSSALPPALVSRLGLHPVASPEEGIAWLQRRCPGNLTGGVASQANPLPARVEAPVRQRAA